MSLSFLDPSRFVLSTDKAVVEADLEPEVTMLLLVCAVSTAELTLSTELSRTVRALPSELRADDRALCASDEDSSLDVIIRRDDDVTFCCLERPRRDDDDEEEEKERVCDSSRFAILVTHETDSDVTPPPRDLSLEELVDDIRLLRDDLLLLLTSESGDDIMPRLNPDDVMEDMVDDDCTTLDLVSVFLEAADFDDVTTFAVVIFVLEDEEEADRDSLVAPLL